MTTFHFETMASGQLFAVESTDVILFAGGSANAASVAFNPTTVEGDTITITFGGHSVRFDFGVVNTAASQNLRFADGSHLAIGGPRPEIYDGGSGDDGMFGGGGDDTLNGHEGANVLQGNAGNDSLVCGAGADTIFGGQGDDVIVSGLGSGSEAGDVVNGNKGNDTITGGGASATLLGGQGDDSIHGGGGGDWISGDRGNDTLAGGVGADSFVAIHDGGDDRVLDFNGAEGDRVHVVAGTTLELHQDGADTLILIDHGSSTMRLVGVQASTLQPDWFVDDGGLGSGETLVGSEVTDVLAGGAGNDSIQGGGGGDWIMGAAGDDTLVGGAGGDVFFAIAHGGDDRVLDFNGAEGDLVRVQAGVAFDIHQDGSDTLIIIDHGSSTMRLVGVQASTLHSDWVVAV